MKNHLNAPSTIFHLTKNTFWAKLKGKSCTGRNCHTKSPTFLQKDLILTNRERENEGFIRNQVKAIIFQNNQRNGELRVRVLSSPTLFQRKQSLFLKTLTQASCSYYSGVNQNTQMYLDSSTVAASWFNPPHSCSLIPPIPSGMGRKIGKESKTCRLR